MKFNYELQTVLGSVYKGGDVQFSPDGRLLISPVGNRLSLFDLLEHRVTTLDAVTHRDIRTICVSPDGRLLLAVDGEGGAAFVNMRKRVVLAQMHFKKPVRVAAFSPNSKLLAVSHGRLVQLWRCPELLTQFRPLALLRTISGHYDDVISLSWSEDGKYLLTGSEDMTARLQRVTGQAQDVEARQQGKVGMAGQEEAGGVKTEEGESASSSSGVLAHLPPIVLSGHRGPIVGAWFGQPSANLQHTPTVYTVSKDGACYVWEWTPEEAVLKAYNDRKNEEARIDKILRKKGLLPAEEEASEEPSKKKLKKEQEVSTHVARPKKGYSTGLFGERGKFTLRKKNYFMQNTKVICCALHAATQVDLLVVGFANGVFGLYELPDFNNIHTLSISQKRISSVCINASGSWLAFGCEKLGQLLVWEWQSESYVLKQQGHFYDVNALSFAPDGQVLATGGDDGKVKLWNSVTGFSFCTFTNHTAPVTAVQFSGVGNVLLTASMDGTVRAFDLVRYRNFRTLTTPQPAQLASLAVDPAGEIVCAGSIEPFEVYVWSLQTGKLLDVLVGHAGPLSGLSFGASSSLLASASWDKSVRLWDVFTGKGLVETFTHTSDVLAVAFRADSKELVSATLDGNLNFWDVPNGALKGVIEGRKDIMGGRRVSDARAAMNATHNTAFTSVCYSSDGKCVLAGGNSRFVCIYDIGSKLLLRKFVLSSNLSLDGILDQLNSKRMTEAGTSMDLIDDEVYDEHEDDPEARQDNTLPGAQTGDYSSRRTRLAVRSKCVRFSPTGGQWAAATTDGLLVFALDTHTIFDPQELEVDITPTNVKKAIEREEYASALRMALALNQPELLRLVVESTPRSKLSLVCRSLPPHRLERFVSFLASTLASSSHLEYMLEWSHAVMTSQAQNMQLQASSMMTTLRQMAKTLTQQHKDVAKICHENQFTLEYLSQLASTSTSLAGASASVELMEDVEEQAQEEEEEEEEAEQQEEEQEQAEEEAVDMESAESEKEKEEEKAERIVVKKEKASPRLGPVNANTNSKASARKQKKQK